MKEYFGYKVSSEGVVYSKRGKKMSSSDNGRGYQILQLRINGKSRTRAVHRLVAELFVENPKGYLEVGHLDGDKLNNSASNLVWCTRSENIQHAYDNGLRSAKGENNSRAKITENDVHWVCQLIVDGFSCAKIAEVTGYPYHAIRRIRCRENWTYISSKYSW